MDSTDKIRATRRRRKHERQAVVFGVLIAFLAVAGLGALATYTGAFSLPNQPDFVVKDDGTVKVAQQPACVPADTMPLPYSKVHVTVLNGSDRGGLAGSVSKLLTDRGFSVDGTGNDTRKPKQPLISFGDDGVAHAYTLLAHYPEAQLVLDSRPGKSVDLTVPESFTALEPEEALSLDAEMPLASVPGCVEAGQITPMPAPTRFDDAEKEKSEQKPKKKKSKKKAKADAVVTEITA